MDNEYKVSDIDQELYDYEEWLDNEQWGYEQAQVRSGEKRTFLEYL